MKKEKRRGYVSASEQWKRWPKIIQHTPGMPTVFQWKNFLLIAAR
jgi:hypothetical protein